jgi:type IV pilus assembly protein PilP
MRVGSVRPVHLIVLAVAAAVLSGCSFGMRDLQDWVATEKAKKGPPLNLLPPIKTFESFPYQAKDLRDPFSAPVTDESESAAANGPQPDRNRPREPLESYPLDTLDMVGTIGSGAGMIALIKDPTGAITRVRAGNYIGQSFGRIIKVNESNIELVELVQHGTSSWIEHPASIELVDSKK